MKLQEVQEILEATLIWDAGCDDREVRSCHASDLISDILACPGTSSLLLTGITNPQVIRTAEILDFEAVCFVRGKQPGEEMVAMAAENGIPLYRTSLSMYESCGRLFAAGLPTGAVKKVTDDWQSQR